MQYLLPHFLSASAMRHPSREAVRMDGVGLTYEQLDRLTNQLARALRQAGVKPGDRVGLYVPKSLGSVIGVFGIMKAGAAYVPLDANAPARRLAYITRDCGVQVIVTASAKLATLAEFLTEGTPLKTVLLTDDPSGSPPEPPAGIDVVRWAGVLRQDATPTDWPESTDNELAYILYTSGSTGMPKGVMISHRTILTFINWATEEFRMVPEDRVTSHAPLHFDLSTFDLYATIKAGATIVLVGESVAALPVRMADLLQNERITIAYLVPSILSFMVSYGKLDAHDFSRLRTVLFAGEVFPIKFLRRLMNAIPHAAFYNLYGPTRNQRVHVLPGATGGRRAGPHPGGAHRARVSKHRGVRPG
jgi:non-ribosomal peptide synthetase component F